MTTAVSHSELIRMLTYKPSTGQFCWAVGRGKRKAGAIAGAISSDGYVVIRINCRQYRAHRLAWFHYHKRWPDGELDHKDGNRLNNAISNLREATRAQNNRNRRAVGVFQNGHSKSTPYLSRIRVDGKTIHLGTFRSHRDASRAYRAATKKYFGAFCRVGAESHREDEAVLGEGE